MLIRFAKPRWTYMLVTSALAVCTVLFLRPSSGYGQESLFFRGKTLTLIIPTKEGGIYDRYARLVAAHLPSYLPHRPNIRIIFKPGGSGIRAANYLYTDARRDGLTFSFIHRKAISAPLLNPKHAKYDTSKFLWLGSLLGRREDVVKLSSRGANNYNIEALNILTLYMKVGYALILPPEVKMSRANTLREALSRMVLDNQFQRDANKWKLPIRFISHQLVNREVQKVFSSRADILRLARKIYASEEQPSCDPCESSKYVSKMCPQERLKKLAQESGGEVDCGCEGSQTLCPQESR